MVDNVSWITISEVWYGCYCFGYADAKVCIRVLYSLPQATSLWLIIWRCFGIASMNHQINEEIRDKEVRLISETGEQLGIMSLTAALDVAEERDLDLVKIAPGSTPPYVKLWIMVNIAFEQSKREKEARKNQRVIEVKEIRMSPSIGVNDFNVKLKNGQKFLRDGDRLKVTIRFRGRQMAHTEIGEELLTRFAAECAEIASMDKNPKLEGRQMSMFLSPKPQSGAKTRDLVFLSAITTQ